MEKENPLWNEYRNLRTARLPINSLRFHLLIESLAIIGLILTKSFEEMVEEENSSKQTRGGFEDTDQPLRPFGLCAGEFTVPDDFDDPLPEEILKGFEGR